MIICVTWFYVENKKMEKKEKKTLHPNTKLFPFFNGRNNETNVTGSV